MHCTQQQYVCTPCMYAYMHWAVWNTVMQCSSRGQIYSHNPLVAFEGANYGSKISISCSFAQCRVLSQTLIVPFDLPSCGPVTASECDHYMKFQMNCVGGKYSPLVGWVIKLGKKLRESNARVQQLREELQSLSSGMVSRNITSWAVCLYFLEQVSFTNIVLT